MKIFLISPVVDVDYENIKEMISPALGLYILEGLTPLGYEVKIIEEEIEEINLDEECDLVGISCMTANAPRAYKLAGEFKKRGKTVIMGGVHPTIMSEEASRYADSIVIGEAEEVWENLLEDFKNKKLKKIYKGAEPKLDKFVPINYKKMKKGAFKPLPVLTSRGCPYNCFFCSISNIYGKKIRHAPITNIIRCIKESRAKYIVFQDDNIVGDPSYAKELFKAMIPLKVKWAGEASMSIANDPELLRLASASGCKGLFIGLESISEIKFGSLKKQPKNIAELEKMIKKIRQVNIHIYASMVFGFDNDTKETFSKTVDFLIKNKISAVAFNILTPYPNTKLFYDMKKEGRILTENWKYYGHNTVVFRPKNMKPDELQFGMLEARKKFYSWPSIFKRFWGNRYYPPLFLASNIINKKEIKRLESKYKAGIGLPNYLQFK